MPTEYVLITTTTGNTPISEANIVQRPLSLSEFTSLLSGQYATAGSYLSLPLSTSAPVNAIAASKILTVSGNPTDKETVTIGAKTYRFRTAIGAAVAATGVLTFTGLPSAEQTVVLGSKTYRWTSAIGAGTTASKQVTFSDVAVNAETITIAGRTYTWKTNLTEAKATSTLTISTNFTDGNSVTIGSTVYTFKETLSSAFQVLIGVSASATLDNLIAAITGAAGEGSTYGTGTTAHPTVTAVAGAGDTMDVTALSIGTAGNSIATTELSGVASWTAGTMSGGLNAVVDEIKVSASVSECIDYLQEAITHWGAAEGLHYSTGTVVNATCSATKDDVSHITINAKVIGYAGNVITISETMTNAAFAGGATALSGGVDAEAANDVLIAGTAEGCIDNLVAAINAAAGAGTTYGTGTTANTLASAAKTAADTLTATAVTAGDAGDDIVTTETSSNASWADTTMDGGIDVAVANDVLIGVNAEASIDNLVLAVTAGAGAGTNYATGTTANATVTGVKSAANTFTATALTKGVSGNSIAIAEACANSSWAGGAVILSGGVDGTVGTQDEIRRDTSYLYICIAVNTIADANWRRVSLGAAF